MVTVLYFLLAIQCPNAMVGLTGTVHVYTGRTLMCRLCVCISPAKASECTGSNTLLRIVCYHNTPTTNAVVSSDIMVLPV